MSSLRRATALAPGNAVYHALLAEHMEGLGMDPRPELVTAVNLSPDDSRFWVRLGFQSEVEGNYAKAEQSLLKAAAINRKFAPRWALMNFYFRRGDTRKFWPWAEESLAMSYGDLAPLFKLMTDATEDEKVVRSHIPNNSSVLLKYFDFLKADGLLDEAAPIAGEVASFAAKGELPALFDYVDRAVEANKPDAVPVWNTLCLRKLIPHLPLDAAGGRIVTGSDFPLPPVPHGFEWRWPSSDSLSFTAMQNQKGVSLRMSGTEPETCAILWQLMPVLPGAQYLLHYEYNSPERSAVSGLFWEVTGRIAPNALLARSAILTPESQLKGETFEFTADEGSYVLLALRYQRPAGLTRAEGTLVIRRVESSRIP